MTQPGLYLLTDLAGPVLTITNWPPLNELRKSIDENEILMKIIAAIDGTSGENINDIVREMCNIHIVFN